jgi:glycosyltransferase involved in cell wall biosynthesis
MKPEQVVVVQTCASLREMDQAQKQPPSNGHNGKNGRTSSLVLYLGAIGPQDGVDLLLHSAHYILREKGRQDVRFRIVGSGTALPQLKEMAAQMSFNGEFEFVGRVEHDQVDNYLSASDICVAPDPSNEFTNHCSMIKIFEYMAHAKPIVLFDLKEGRRSAGESALYAQPNDPRDFGEKILKLVDSKALRETLGERGRKRVDDTFNWEAQSKKLIEAYQRVLA